MSMRLGDVKSAMFILERRFGNDYGRQQQVNVKSQSENLDLNLNATVTQDEKEKIRASIIARLQPKN